MGNSRSLEKGCRNTKTLGSTCLQDALITAKHMPKTHSLGCRAHRCGAHAETQLLADVWPYFL